MNVYIQFIYFSSYCVLGRSLSHTCVVTVITDIACIVGNFCVYSSRKDLCSKRNYTKQILFLSAFWVPVAVQVWIFSMFPKLFPRISVEGDSKSTSRDLTFWMIFLCRCVFVRIKCDCRPHQTYCWRCSGEDSSDALSCILYFTIVSCTEASSVKLKVASASNMVSQTFFSMWKSKENVKHCFLHQLSQERAVNPFLSSRFSWICTILYPSSESGDPESATDPKLPGSLA